MRLIVPIEDFTLPINNGLMKNGNVKQQAYSLVFADPVQSMTAQKSGYDNISALKWYMGI